MRQTIFLLSPAYCAGRRAAILLRPGSEVPIARRLQAGELTLGEAFSFLSGLYFRGKLTYALAFGRRAGAADATLVITPTRGLQSPALRVTAELIREFAGVDIASNDPRYAVPLERDVAQLAAALPDDARAVLLGSVATGKYVELLARLLGPRLHYPPSFIGRGDMSRGGLLLRHAREAAELDYDVLHLHAPRHGPRPPKLPPERHGRPVRHLRLKRR
ncbi:MAG TPA: hypothetical protein VJN96_00945 [Vicinamibacterales bacterium]|nr:hypothetical protein [Vicinamibacterales bacterium]